MLDKLAFLDIHYHADPDLYRRRYHALQAGEIFQKLNGGVVLKSHLGSTAVQATLAQQCGLPVFPSIVLNQIAGGINYRAVLQALAEYQPVFPSKLIVHLPTLTGRKHASKLLRQMTYPQWEIDLCHAETIFTKDNKIKNELLDLLKLARDYPIVISSGHASREEILALIDICGEWNLPALLLNQPANPMTGFNVQDLLMVSKYSFIWIEQTALTYLVGYQDTRDFSQTLAQVPQLIYSSDLGQINQIDIYEWLEKSKHWFDQFAILNTRRTDICLNNPLNLIKVE
jgi:hypothetical protein